MRKKVKNNNKNNNKKGTIIGLIVSVAILGAIATAMTVGFITSSSMLNTSNIELENLYERAYFDLVENVNNAEIKMSKLLVSNDNTYSQKLLEEINENTTDAQNNISFLPLSVNGISETISFINQLSGYTLSLSNKISTEKTKLTNEETKKLQELYTEIKNIKTKLNEISMQIVNGYNITDSSKNTKEEYNDFTTTIQAIKATDEEYPSMIYDGPFSDSELNKEIKGLNFEEKTKEECESLLREYFSNYDIKSISNKSETTGKFLTYDFSIEFENGYSMFAQLTKKGGKLLTVSSYSDNQNISKNLGEAKAISETFASNLTNENMKCVWSTVTDNNAYINLAPITNNVILYPDLIKMKIDLSNGMIIGYEAQTYYTNHTTRQIGTATFDVVTATQNLNPNFEVITQKLCLAPIDYGKEVLCYEFYCEYNDSEYYVYVNAKDGNEENILKVISSNSGNKLL